MNAPMVGSWVVDVRAVRPFTIHGDLYYELHVTRRDGGDDDGGAGQVLALKVPAHAITGAPAAGQTLSVTFLMGQVTAARPVATTGADAIPPVRAVGPDTENTRRSSSP